MYVLRFLKASSADSSTGKSPVASFFHLGRSKQSRTKSLEYLQTGLNSILVSNVEEDWTEVFIPSIVHHVLNKAVRSVVPSVVEL